MTNYKKLRYKITSWRQLPKCLSNNDRDLKIVVSDIIGNRELRGLRISVVHPRFGTLFSEVLNASGSYITSREDTSNVTTTAFELDTDVILKELRKYGFFVTYEQEKHLPLRMLNYLSTLKGLGFDKLRVLNVWDTNAQTSEKEYKWYVVVFQTCKHKDWLNNSYCPSRKEFVDALVDGTAVNVSDISYAKGMNWSWLDFVANIDDVLKENIKYDAESGEG